MATALNLNVAYAVADAIALVEARQREEGGYPYFSLRGALHAAGYDKAEQDAVIRTVANAGFSYCVDPIVPVKVEGVADLEHPSEHACTWGWDQLISRLQCVRIEGVRRR